MSFLAANIVRLNWRPFEQEFSSCLERMRRSTQNVEREAFACTAKAVVATSKPKDAHVNLPCHSLAYPPNPQFYPRDSVRTALEHHFQPANPSSQKSFCVWGAGGCGKTQIANHFVHSHLTEYDAVFWCHADTVAKLQESTIRFAVQLGLQQVGADTTKCRQSVLNWLQTTSKSTWMDLFRL